MLKEKKIVIKDIDGKDRTYIISRVPATYAREIITQYPTSAAPKIGSYKLNEELMFKLLSYVQVELKAGLLTPLDSRELIDNHIPDGETLMRLEKAMLEYNSNFLSSATISSFLSVITQIMKASSTKMSTDLSQQSSAKDEPATTN